MVISLSTEKSHAPGFLGSAADLKKKSFSKRSCWCNTFYSTFLAGRVTAANVGQNHA
jgi:hypothetical protein